MIRKKDLTDGVTHAVNSTTDALQTIFDALNKGQKQKLLKNEKIAELLHRYNVDTSAANNG